MTNTSSLLSGYLKPLEGLPCWNATAEYGSWLSLSFGLPHLVVREGNPKSQVKSYRRRAVFVEGEFLLWVQTGAWEILAKGKRIFHSGQSRERLRVAAARLDSQKLLRIELNVDPLCTIFTFELGSQLHTFPDEASQSDETLWSMHALGNCLSLLANGTLEYGSDRSKKPRRTTVRAAALDIQSFPLSGM